MRNAFVRELTALAAADPSVMLLTGDLGFTVLENFRDTFPNQYLNAGVAEQNMIGVATGLAMSGRRVFVYSIIPFVTFRCFEHIRNDICYHNVNVCVTGVGSGYSYGHMGSTHHALEDIATLRSLPNMSVICPGDPLETAAAVRAIGKHHGPCYLRLGKAGEKNIHPGDVTLTIGRALTLREGKDITLISTGNMLETAAQAADLLAQKGISVRHVSMHTVKPIDAEAVASAAKDTRLIVTVEEHSRIGGLGSAVAETLSEWNLRIPHILCSAPDAFATTVGSQGFFRKAAGLTPEAIAEKVLATNK